LNIFFNLFASEYSAETDTTLLQVSHILDLKKEKRDSSQQGRQMSSLITVGYSI